MPSTLVPSKGGKGGKGVAPAFYRRGCWCWVGWGGSLPFLVQKKYPNTGLKKGGGGDAFAPHRWP